MKKFAKILIVALITIVLATALIACGDKNTHKGEFTHEINNVDDLKKISEMLGSDYDKGVFELKSDVTISEDWTSLGSSVENSFRGTLNGNNHTITYKIYIPEPEERDVKSAIANEKYYGLFGVLHNAKISNLTINVDVTVPVDAESFFVGGLAGFMSGNNEIKNVTINGYISTTMGNICKYIDEENDWRESERYAMTAYVGGLAGFAQGNSVIDGVSSGVSIDVGAYESGCISGINDLFVGGVVGAMRTVNLSSLKDNNEYCYAKNLTFTGSLKAIGSQVNAGGIFGAAYRIKDGEKWFTNTSGITARAYKRLRIGGIAGIIDRVNVNKAKVDLNALNAETFSSSTSKSFNVGGLVGYAANFSNVSDVISNVNKITVATDTVNYTGGIVGMLHYSSISNAVASGELFYGRYSMLNAATDVRYEGNTQNNPYYIYNGGAVGRLYGESKLNAISTTFKAYQGLVGEVARAVEIIIIKEGDGETYEDWFNNTVYDANMITKSKDGDLEDGEQKYRIIHNYDLSATNLTFVKTNSRCYNDTLVNDKASEWYNGIGQEQNDETAYNALYNTINSNINA